MYLFKGVRKYIQQEGRPGAVAKSSPLVPRGPGFEPASLHCTLQGVYGLRRHISRTASIHMIMHYQSNLRMVMSLFPASLKELPRGPSSQQTGQLRRDANIKEGDICAFYFRHQARHSM